MAERQTADQHPARVEVAAPGTDPSVDMRLQRVADAAEAAFLRVRFAPRAEGWREITQAALTAASAAGQPSAHYAALAAAETALMTVLVGDGETPALRQTLPESFGRSKCETALVAVHELLEAAGWATCEDCGNYHPDEQLLRVRIERDGRVDRRCQDCHTFGEWLRGMMRAAGELPGA